MGRALHALVLREQHYAQSMQFGVERFVLPLAGRTDILTPQEHKLLFQNCEEVNLIIGLACGANYDNRMIMIFTAIKESIYFMACHYNLQYKHTHLFETALFK